MSRHLFQEPSKQVQHRYHPLHLYNQVVDHLLFLIASDINSETYRNLNFDEVIHTNINATVITSTRRIITINGTITIVIEFIITICFRAEFSCIINVEYYISGCGRSIPVYHNNILRTSRKFCCEVGCKTLSTIFITCEFGTTTILFQKIENGISLIWRR